MNESDFTLPNPPIVEAVLDIECDLPPGQVLADLEDQARQLFRDQYPTFKRSFFQEHKIQAKLEAEMTLAVRKGLQALQFYREDEKQLVQMRQKGFSFNRLAPYTSFDDYLPEIERSWRLYVSLTAPVEVRLIRLRYINRILLPLTEGQVPLEDYLKVGRYPSVEDKLKLVGFLNQYTAMETETGHEVNVVVTAQKPEGEKLPVIFDNGVTAAGSSDPESWPWILTKIQELRNLKNSVFRNTLTERCLNLFRQT